jgi:class 3 adenylate cyclase/pimeloyl-ACP methyl ester carboxylesterase
MQQQRIHFAHTSDDVTIAYAAVGSGFPLIIAPSWVSHLEIENQMPATRSFYEALARSDRMLVRFDSRGTGLSDRNVDDLSAEARALDFEAATSSLGIDRAAVFAWSMGGPPAIIYAARNPDKVSHLILYATFARAFARGRTGVGKALVDLTRAHWGIGAKAVFEFIYPGAPRDVADAVTSYLNVAASGEVAATIFEESLFNVDVREYLPKLTMPVLVLHRREDDAVEFEMGRELAALLPHGHFVPLAGNAHTPFFGDTQPILDAINDFLATQDGHHTPEAATESVVAAAPPGHLQTILFTDMEGSTGFTQRLGDERAQELVRVHNNLVRDALRTHGGAEIKHTGDGIMATFPLASRALDCAVAIQMAFAEHNTAAGDEVRVRIGLNAGEPVAEEKDLFGAAVQMAARICAEAKPGQILVSNVVRELTMGKGFLFADQGNISLRGFEDPVRLFEVPW